MTGAGAYDDVPSTIGGHVGGHMHGTCSRTQSAAELSIGRGGLLDPIRTGSIRRPDKVRRISKESV